MSTNEEKLCGSSLRTAALIPRPVKQENRDGVFESDAVPGIAGDSFFNEEIALFSSQLAARFGDSANSARILCSKLDEGALAAEGYQLKIGPERIDLAAATKAGMCNGLQSLRQLFLSGNTGDVFAKECGGHFVIPCADIEDAPRYPWRGFMLDCSRHFYHVSFIKKMIDALSLHHINVFHWHLSDDQGWRLPVPEYPELTKTGTKRRDLRRQEEVYEGEGFYTEEDIRDIVAFAGARHITVVPEVDLPGHTISALAAYPELGCTGGPYQVEYRTGVFKDILCAGNDRIFDFAAAVFDSMVRLFPGKYIHIGGDEAPTARWKDCPRCQKRMAELGLAEPRQLQRWLTRRFTEMLAERGKTAIGWDEVLEGVDSGGPTALPDGLVVMYWRSWPEMDMKPLLDAASRGRSLIMTPCNHGAYLNFKQSPEPDSPGAWEPITLRDSYAVPLALPGMTPEQEKAVLGGQGNIWAELIHCAKDAEYMIFPRLCALAEAFWTPQKLRDFDDFSIRLPVHRKRLDSLGFLQCR